MSPLDLCQCMHFRKDHETLKGLPPLGCCKCGCLRFALRCPDHKEGHCYEQSVIPLYGTGRIPVSTGQWHCVQCAFTHRTKPPPYNWHEEVTKARTGLRGILAKLVRT